MSILFGHPGGNPNSHHAALAHFEAGRLEAFCVPWMPSSRTLCAIQRFAPTRSLGQRLARRAFEPLAGATMVQGRAGEWRRLATRAFGFGNERLSYEANDWLMRTMAKECRRPAVTAVHSYEDCSEKQFVEAKRREKACIYDMPIGYFPFWERTQAELVERYRDWVPEQGLPSSRYVRPEQKRREMELADLVLSPSSFVETTVLTFHPEKKVARAAYGVDLEFWKPEEGRSWDHSLRFLYAGQMSLRKGIPTLLEAWEAAGLREARLDLVGVWQLAKGRMASLPRGVTLWPPCSREALRERYRQADVFLFPSFFEGFGLVLLEAMACGLPAMATEATAGPDVLTDSCGRLVPRGNLEAIVGALHWFKAHQGQLPSMAHAARAQAMKFTWENYRRGVSEAVAPFV